MNTTKTNARGFAAGAAVIAALAVGWAARAARPEVTDPWTRFAEVVRQSRTAYVYGQVRQDMADGGTSMPFYAQVDLSGRRAFYETWKERIYWDGHALHHDERGCRPLDTAAWGDLVRMAMNEAIAGFPRTGARQVKGSEVLETKREVYDSVAPWYQLEMPDVPWPVFVKVKDSFQGSQPLPLAVVVRGSDGKPASLNCHTVASWAQLRVLLDVPLEDMGPKYRLFERPPGFARGGPHGGPPKFPPVHFWTWPLHERLEYLAEHGEPPPEAGPEPAVLNANPDGVVMP